MNELGIKFGNLALVNVLARRYHNELICEGTWEKYAKQFFKEDCFVNNACPKNTFLGMCSEGLIKDIPVGNYLKKRTVDTEYAKIAVAVLKKYKSYTDRPNDLWKKVLKCGNYNADTPYNFQMDVICTLWKSDMVNTNAVSAVETVISDYFSVCDFKFDGNEYIVRQLKNNRYEIADLKTNEKVSNMKDVAQKYFKSVGIDEIKGHTYDILKLFIAYLLYIKEK